jgi:hypothetical protein
MIGELTYAIISNSGAVAESYNNDLHPSRRLLVIQGRILFITSVCRFHSSILWLPNIISTFSPRSFMKSISLKAILFETGTRLHRIREEAFSWSTLPRISLPDSVKFLGNACFSHCSFLTEVVIQNTSQLQTISSAAFSFSGITRFSLEINPFHWQLSF